MAEVTVTWHQDGPDWLGGVSGLPSVILLIEPAPWGKSNLRVFQRGQVKHERLCKDVDEAKESAMAACRLLALREAV